MSKSETNSKLKFPNVQNSAVFVKGGKIACVSVIGALEVRLLFVNFDIRISCFPACPA